MIESLKRMTEKEIDILKQYNMIDSLATSVREISMQLSDLANKVDNHAVNFAKYVEADIKWKEAAQPVIQMGQNVQGFGKVSLYILGFFAAVAGAVVVLLNFFNKHS